MASAGMGRRTSTVVAAAVVVVFGGALQAQGGSTTSPPPERENFSRPIELTPEEREIFDRTNAYRVRCGLPPVSLNPQLVRAARYFAIYMSITGDFDHDADGRGPGARAAKFGYNWSLVCENIAYRYKAYDVSMHDLPSDFVEGWIQSAGHRKNMLCDEVVETGVGVAVGKNPRHQYSVQVFGKQRGQLFTFKIVNDSGVVARYVLGRQVFTLRPGHTRIHPDSEQYPTYFEAIGRDGSARTIPMQRREGASPSYRIVRDGSRGATVITGPT